MHVRRATLVGRHLATRAWLTRLPITASLRKRDEFDTSVSDFSERYADQNEQHCRAVADAVRPDDSTPSNAAEPMTATVEHAVFVAEGVPEVVGRRSPTRMENEV